MLIRRDFGTLHHDLLGPDDAPVVCLLHSLTSDGGAWAEQVPALLAAGFRVLRLDMRGHGGSDAPDSLWRMGDLAGDVIAVLDGLGIARVHLVGLSIGGMIGQELALGHGERLHSLAACATVARWPGDGGLLTERIAAVEAAGTLEAVVDGAMDHRYPPAFRASRPERWAALRESFLGTTIRGHSGCCHAILHHDVLDRLPDVRVPTLVVTGSADVDTPPAAGREIAEAIPGAIFHEIAGAKHFPNVSHPDAFNALLVPWLQARG